MTSLELITIINQALFVGLFVVVLWHAFRRRTRAAFNTALLFGAIAGVVLISRVAGWLGFSGDPLVAEITLLLLSAAPFAMLRLVNDFSDSPRWVELAGAGAFLLLAALSIASFGQIGAPVLVAMIAFFLVVGGYAAFAFALESRRAHGLTRRRMAAVATGAGLFIGAVVTVVLGALVEPLSATLALVGQVAALAAVLAFFIGFAPPSWVRRAWREPDLRQFLERSVHLTGVTDEHAAITELQRAAATTFGAPGAAIGLADADRGILRYASPDGGWEEYPDDMFIAGQAYRDQRRMVVRDARVADPDHATTYERVGARTVIAVPVTSETGPIGVLSVFAERAPIFVDDDLWLLELVASQVALLLEARTLTTHAGELRAREEATRLKEEFLSAAAHDLRTPLTVVLGQAELMERRAARNPGGPVDDAGLARIVREARRLRDLIAELLDAQRLEDGRAILERTPADLRDVVEAVRERHVANGARISVRLPVLSLVSAIDRPRIEQVLDNLVENALKYGAPEGMLEIDVAEAEGQARITVIDRGLGIPESERTRIFERFYRASNAHDVTDTGLGLGLFICRRIIEEHEGHIRSIATPGGGSTFIVELPLEPLPQRFADPAPAADPDVASRASAAQAVADA